MHPDQQEEEAEVDAPEAKSLSPMPFNSWQLQIWFVVGAEAKCIMGTMPEKKTSFVLTSFDKWITFEQAAQEVFSVPLTAKRNTTGIHEDKRNKNSTARTAWPQASSYSLAKLAPPDWTRRVPSPPRQRAGNRWRC